MEVGVPFGDIAKYLGGGTVALVVAAVVCIELIERIKASRANNAEHDARAGVYEQLQQQIAQQTESLAEANRRIDSFANERNELVVKVGNLEGKLAALSRVAEENDRLRAKLDAKDAEIRKLISDHAAQIENMMNTIRGKDQVILSQVERMSALERQVSDLELRLAMDERELRIEARKKVGTAHIGVDGYVPPATGESHG